MDLPAANAIYPIYNLMNSQCYCNTRCNIEEGTLQMSVRAQVFIRKGLTYWATNKHQKYEMKLAFKEHSVEEW